MFFFRIGGKLVESKGVVGSKGGRRKGGDGVIFEEEGKKFCRGVLVWWFFF